MNHPRPCWHCEQFDGLAGDGTAALCRLPDGPRVRALPHQGCAFFERVPGCDDEAGPPEGYAGSTAGVEWRKFMPE